MFGYSEITRRLTSIESRLREMMMVVLEVDERLSRVWFAVNRPNTLGVTVLKEDDMIRFGIILPVRPVSNDDWDEISSGTLSVKVGDKEPVIVATSKATQVNGDRVQSDPLFSGAQGDKCRASFAYIDNAGNVGAAVELDFELIDTIPPVSATELGVAMLEEVPDPAPEPQPEPQPEPDPTPDPDPEDEDDEEDDETIG